VVVSNFNLIANDSDADDGLDPASIFITFPPANGSLQINADGTVDYTYDGLGAVSDSFGYNISDTRGFWSNQAIVSFSVNVVPNLPPVAADDASTLDAGLTALIDVTANDSDPDNGLDLTSVVVVSQPANGALVNNADGTLSYTHDGGPSVVDSFTYTIADMAGVVSNVATVSLTINQAGAPLAVSALLPGDLVVTEVMQNPSAVSDTLGEWFELFNASGVDVDLNGLVVSDTGADSFVVAGSVVIPAAGYALFVKNADPLANGGLPMQDYTYGSGMSLGNGADELILSGGLVTIDQISWDGGPLWPDPTGASMSLGDASVDVLSNDQGAAWCTASALYGVGDMGTPGAPNGHLCP